MSSNGKGFFDTITEEIGSLEKKITGGGLGKQVTGLLEQVKSFDPQQIQSILSALGQSTDAKVQDAKQDLEKSKTDGADFVEKLKGYVANVPQILKTLLPTLQSMLGKK